MSRQLPLDLPLPARLTRQDFLPAPANRAALAWIERWPQWDEGALVLYGPQGAGKSHLCAIWAAEARALTLPARVWAEGEPRTRLGAAAAVVLDDLDCALAAAGLPLARSLYALWQALIERRGFLLASGTEPPARWSIGLPDLASRLRAAPSVALGPPDDALLRAVLVKLLSDRQIAASPEAIDYLALRCERSFDFLRRLASALDRAALAERRRLTLPLAREVLGRLAT